MAWVTILVVCFYLSHALLVISFATYLATERTIFNFSVFEVERVLDQHVLEFILSEYIFLYSLPLRLRIWGCFPDIMLGNY